MRGARFVEIIAASGAPGCGGGVSEGGETDGAPGSEGASG